MCFLHSFWLPNVTFAPKIKNQKIFLTVSSYLLWPSFNVFQITSLKDETDDEDLLESYSINVETGEFEKSFGKEKSRKRQYIFVTEDGKTAECIDDLGKEWVSI